MDEIKQEIQDLSKEADSLLLQAAPLKVLNPVMHNRCLAMAGRLRVLAEKVEKQA